VCGGAVAAAAAESSSLSLRRCVQHARRGTAARLACRATARDSANVFCQARAAHLCRTPSQRAAQHALHRCGHGAGCCAAHDAFHPCAACNVAHSTLSLFFPARPGRTRASCSVKALQPAPRGGALAASAGEADDGGEGGVSDGAFFNRLAELHSLSTLLAGPPRAVLVVTGPPSCGKSGVRAPSSCGLLLGLR
jgi:hypothetical protein